MLLMLAVRRMSSDHLEGVEGKFGKEEFSLEMVQFTISLQSNSLTLISCHIYPISLPLLPLQKFVMQM